MSYNELDFSRRNIVFALSEVKDMFRMLEILKPMPHSLLLNNYKFLRRQLCMPGARCSWFTPSSPSRKITIKPMVI